MEKLKVNQSPPKQSRVNKKQPLKVVYISNPVRVEASPAEFRGIVEKLTGRDSDVAEWSDFPSTAAAGDPPAAAPDPTSRAAGGAARLQPDPADGRAAAGQLEAFDEAFTSQMLEDFPWFGP